MLPASRHQFILNQLQTEGIVHIEALSSALGVSTMTIHRDLDRLAGQGLLRKVRGGAIPVAASPAADNACATCRGPVQARMQVLIHLADGSERRACCAHCGLMDLARNERQVTAVLVTDFLFGQTLGAHQAHYLVDPEITICCRPTVIPFSTADDAARFQRGFGGEVMTLDEAKTFMQHAMHVH